jgi:hypothetical protein
MITGNLLLLSIVCFAVLLAADLASAPACRPIDDRE